MKVVSCLAFSLFLVFSFTALDAADLSRLMQYAKAGRLDLAKDEGRELLKQELTEEERALVLYDLASIYLALGYLNEAEATFNELDSQLLQSKTVQEYAAQNQALCKILLVQRKIETGIGERDPRQIYEECMRYLQEAKDALSNMRQEKQKIYFKQIYSMEARLCNAFQKWQIEELGKKQKYAEFCARLFEKEKEVLASLEELSIDSILRKTIQVQVSREVEWFLQANSLKEGALPELTLQALKELKAAQDTEIAVHIEMVRFLIALFQDVQNIPKLIEHAATDIVAIDIVAMGDEKKARSQVLSQFMKEVRAKKQALLSKILRTYKEEFLKRASSHVANAFSLYFEAELLAKVEAVFEKNALTHDFLSYLATLYQDENESFKELFEKKCPQAVWFGLLDRVDAKQKTYAKLGKKEKAEGLENVQVLLKGAQAQYPQKTLLIQAWLQEDDRACFRELISLFDKENEDSSILKWIVFAWQRQKMHFYDTQLENRGDETIEQIEEILNLQKEGFFTNQTALFASLCVKHLEYLLFFQDQFSENPRHSLLFCIGFEKAALSVLDTIEMLKKTANKEGKALFFKQQKMIAATAESFLKQIASFPLQEEDEKERKSYLEFLAVHSPSLETVGAERRMHQKIKNFLEKLLTNYAASPNSKEESKPNQTPKNHETNSQELLRKNMQIQPDVARSQLLQMEEEDRTKKGVSQKFEVKRPW